MAFQISKSLGRSQNKWCFRSWDKNDEWNYSPNGLVDKIEVCIDDKVIKTYSL